MNWLYSRLGGTRRWMLAGFALLAGASNVAAQSTVLDPLPRDLEMRIALSAAPAHVREEASVYVLNPKKGFERARAGSNGFACLVIRTEWRMPQYRDDIVIPVCWDAAGVEALMPLAFDVEALRASGISKAALTREINRKFETGEYHAPTRSGVAPMLSPIFRSYGGSDTPRLIDYPHLMFYAPGVTNDQIGGARPQHPSMPWILGEDAGGPHALMIQGVGQQEVASIKAEHKELIADFCAYRPQWCEQRRERTVKPH